MVSALEMRGITKAFFGKKAVDNVDFTLKPGSIHGLLGENGAGKTTLMNILYGLYRQEAGDVWIRGKHEEIDSPAKAIKLGVGMVHQHFMLVRPLSVTENVVLGRKSSRGIFLDTSVVSKKLAELSEKYELAVDPNAKIWQLSVGEQQRVEILTTIYQGADILILDEPTSVLTPQESELLFNILRKMRDEGKSIILITHKLEEIISVVDEVTVLRDGQLISSVPVTSETTKDDLARMMVGRDVLFDFEHTRPTEGDICLKMINVCTNNDKGVSILHDFCIDVKYGEILGVAGVDGNGQKELAEVLTGLRLTTAGQITIGGKPATGQAPIFYIQQGVAHIPEDRHHTGLAMRFSIAKNLIIKNYRKQPFSRFHWLRSAKIQKHAEEIVDEYAIKSNSVHDIVKDLSGGNQQKVILAREISDKPKLLIASHPTRGLDVGATEYVRERILSTRDKGTAVLLISTDLEEIIQLSDRIAVIYNGRLMGVLPRDTDINEIGLMMMGRNEGANQYAQ